MFRGRRLAPPPKRGVRPTADPVREALFNILGPSVADRPFLDLAAGTGAVGLEALSRGAAPVVLVERDRASLAVARRNVDLLALDQEQAGLVFVVAADVGVWLERGGEGLVPGEAGVVFLDPPYGEPRLPKWLDRLAAAPFVGPGTLVVVEHRTGDAPAAPAAWETLWTRRYGDASLTAFAPRGEDRTAEGEEP
ncbi:MAG: 16S rRNA (guanine(966)-N(2))-methyltransferase RsmD [Candidatus Polarisedimenticolia bacterium]